MKQFIIIVGLFSVACYGKPIAGRWCGNPCDSIVEGTLGYPSPADQVLTSILPEKQEKGTAGNRVTARGKAPVMAPLVTVRSIADDGDDLWKSYCTYHMSSPELPRRYYTW